MGDLLEELEMHVGVVGSHMGELAGVGLGLTEDAEGEEDGEWEGGSGARVG